MIHFYNDPNQKPANKSWGEALGTGLQDLIAHKTAQMNKKRQSEALISEGVSPHLAGVWDSLHPSIQKSAYESRHGQVQEAQPLKPHEFKAQQVAQEKQVEKNRSLNLIGQAQKLINASKGQTSLGLAGNITPKSLQSKESKQLQQIAASLIPKNAKAAEIKQWKDALLPTIYDSPKEQYEKLEFLKKQLVGEEEEFRNESQQLAQQEQNLSPEKIASSPEAIAAQNGITQPEQQQPEQQDGYQGPEPESALGWAGRQVVSAANNIIGTPYNLVKAMSQGANAVENLVNSQNRNQLNKALENPNITDFQRQNVEKSLAELDERENNPAAITKGIEVADEQIKNFQDTLFGEDYLNPKNDVEESAQDLATTIGLSLATGTPWNALAHVAKRAAQGIAVKQGIKAVGGGQAAQLAGRIGFPLLLDMFNPKNIISKVSPVVDKRYKEATKLAGAKTINVDPFRQVLEDIHDNAIGHPQYNTYRKDLSILEEQLGSKFNEFPIRDLPSLKERVNKFAYKFNLDEFKPAVPAVHELIDEATHIVPAWGKEIRSLDKITGALAEMKDAKTFFENFKDINTYKSIPAVSLRAIKSIFSHPNVKGVQGFSKLGYQDKELAMKYMSEILQAASKSQKGNFIKAATDLGKVLEHKKEE